MKDIRLLTNEQLHKVQRRTAENYYHNKSDILLTNNPIRMVNGVEILKQSKQDKFEIITAYESGTFTEKADRFIELHCKGKTGHYYVMTGCRDWVHNHNTGIYGLHNNDFSEINTYPQLTKYHYVVDMQNSMTKYYEENNSLIGGGEYTYTGGEIEIFDITRGLSWKPVLKCTKPHGLYVALQHRGDIEIHRIDAHVSWYQNKIKGYFYAKYIGETNCLLEKGTIIRVAHGRVMNDNAFSAIMNVNVGRFIASLHGLILYDPYFRADIKHTDWEYVWGGDYDDE